MKNATKIVIGLASTALFVGGCTAAISPSSSGDAVTSNDTLAEQANMTADDVTDLIWTPQMTAQLCPAYEMSPSMVRSMALSNADLAEAADAWGFTQSEVAQSILDRLATEC